MHERQVRADGGPARRRRDAVAVRADDRAAVRLHEGADGRVDRVLGVEAAHVGGEHVREPRACPTPGRRRTHRSPAGPPAAGTCRPGRTAGWSTRCPPGSSRRASWTAVAISVGLVWSSRTTPLILWPSIPPSAFCRAIRALKPAGGVAEFGRPFARQRGDHDEGDGRARRAAAPATPSGQARDADPRGEGERRQPQPALVPARRFPHCCFPPQEVPPDAEFGTIGIHALSARVSVRPLRPGLTRRVTFSGSVIMRS